MTEQDLREMLAPGGSHHKNIIEGGAWWRHTEIRRAEKRGDHEMLKQLEAEQDAAVAAIVGNTTQS
jgi:hypothetical protein